MKLPNDNELPLTLSVGEELPDELDATRYRIDAFIARGGMGEVYDATRLSDGARVAVKCVRYDLVTNPTVLLRSRFEAQAFRKIDHPNVVPVYGTGVRGNNVPWMAMQRLRGFSLEQVIELRGKIPLRWAIEVVRDLCKGLHPIHKWAIHRDIKPSNLHLGFDAVLRVLDLGVAKSKEPNVHMTTTGYQLGTLPYMAPEQLENNADIDHRADLWAACVVLYILVTGVHPFAPPGSMPLNKVRLGYSILQDPHRPLTSVLEGAPPWLDQIIEKGLAKDPEHRHRSAQELAEVLTAALDYLQTKTGHAEPLSSLIEQLRLIEQLHGRKSLAAMKPPPSAMKPPPSAMKPPPSAMKPPPSAMKPPPPIWTPPRTTEPMPPPAHVRDEPASDASVRIVSPSPRNAEPVPAPSSASAPQREPAPELTSRHIVTNEPTDHGARPAMVPPASESSSPPPEERAGREDEDAAKPRESDVRVRRAPPQAPQPLPAEPQAARPAPPAIDPTPAARSVTEGTDATPRLEHLDPRRRIVAAPSAAALAGAAPPAAPVAMGGAPQTPALPARRAAPIEQPTPLAQAHDAPVQEDVPPKEAAHQQRRWLGKASLFGAPRWLVVLLSTSAVVSSAELVYFFRGSHVSPRTGPIELPASSLPTQTDEPPPVPVAGTIESPQAEPPQAPPPTAVPPAQEAALATAAPSAPPALPSALPALGPVHTAASMRKPTPSPEPALSPPTPAPTAPHRVFGTEN